METKEIAKQEEQSVFVNTKAFEHAQRVAKMLSNSDLVPAQFKGKVDNCIIALNMANRMKADPLMVMQNLYIVHGKPAWSSIFLIASLSACGKFSPLRYEEDDKEGGRCRAVATNLQTKEICEGVWVSMEMAAAEGWIAKNGSKWKTMPQLMRRYRAGTFFTRQFAPEVSMGFQTQEEVQDVHGIVDVVAEEVKEVPPLAISELLATCENLEDIDLLREGNPDLTDEERKLVDAKEKEIKSVKKK